MADETITNVSIRSLPPTTIATWPSHTTARSPGSSTFDQTAQVALLENNQPHTAAPGDQDWQRPTRLAATHSKYCA